MAIRCIAFNRAAMTCSLQEIFPQMAHVTLYQQRTFLKTDSPLTQTVSRISSSSSTPSASASSPSTAQSTSSEDGASPLPFSAIPGPRGVAQWPVLGAVMLFKPFSKFIVHSQNIIGRLFFLLDVQACKIIAFTGDIVFICASITFKKSRAILHRPKRLLSCE